jgi:hypothetical protein
MDSWEINADLKFDNLNLEIKNSKKNKEKNKSNKKQRKSIV